MNGLCEIIVSYMQKQLGKGIVNNRQFFLNEKMIFPKMH